jgi:hypothetical protein
MSTQAKSYAAVLKLNAAKTAAEIKALKEKALADFKAEQAKKQAHLEAELAALEKLESGSQQLPAPASKAGTANSNPKTPPEDSEQTEDEGEDEDEDEDEDDEKAAVVIPPAPVSLAEVAAEVPVAATKAAEAEASPSDKEDAPDKEEEALTQEMFAGLAKLVREAKDKEARAGHLFSDAHYKHVGAGLEHKNGDALCSILHELLIAREQAARDLCAAQLDRARRVKDESEFHFQNQLIRETTHKKCLASVSKLMTALAHAEAKLREAQAALKGRSPCTRCKPGKPAATSLATGLLHAKVAEQQPEAKHIASPPAVVPSASVSASASARAPAPAASASASAEKTHAKETGSLVDMLYASVVAKCRELCGDLLELKTHSLDGDDDDETGEPGPSSFSSPEFAMRRATLHACAGREVVNGETFLHLLATTNTELRLVYKWTVRCDSVTKSYAILQWLRQELKRVALATGDNSGLCAKLDGVISFDESDDLNQIRRRLSRTECGQAQGEEDDDFFLGLPAYPGLETSQELEKSMASGSKPRNKRKAADQGSVVPHKKHAASASASSSAASVFGSSK